MDNADRYALATLRLGARGAARPVRFARRAFEARAREDSAPGAVLATLLTEPRAAPRPLHFYVSDRGFLDTFAINGAGEVLLRKPLDYETADSYAYQVMVTDGITVSRLLPRPLPLRRRGDPLLRRDGIKANCQS